MVTKQKKQKDISPNSILISGGQMTVANLFYNMGRENVGLVGLWDCVAFDELRPWYLWETSIKAWMQYVMGHSDAQITMKNSIAVRWEKENDISAIIVFDVTRAWAETKTSKDIGERP